MNSKSLKNDRLLYLPINLSFANHPLNDKPQHQGPDSVQDIGVLDVQKIGKIVSGILGSENRIEGRKQFPLGLSVGVDLHKQELGPEGFLPLHSFNEKFHPVFEGGRIDIIGGLLLHIVDAVLAQYSFEKSQLVGEVIVERTSGNSQSASQITHAHSGIAPFGNNLEAGVYYFAPVFIMINNLRHGKDYNKTLVINRCAGRGTVGAQDPKVSDTRNKLNPTWRPKSDIYPTPLRKCPILV